MTGGVSGGQGSSTSTTWRWMRKGRRKTRKRATWTLVGQSRQSRQSGQSLQWGNKRRRGSNQNEALVYADSQLPSSSELLPKTADTGHSAALATQQEMVDANPNHAADLALSGRVEERFDVLMSMYTQEDYDNYMSKILSKRRERDALRKIVQRYRDTQDFPEFVKNEFPLTGSTEAKNNMLRGAHKASQTYGKIKDQNSLDAYLRENPQGEDNLIQWVRRNPDKASVFLNGKYNMPVKRLNKMHNKAQVIWGSITDQDSYNRIVKDKKTKNALREWVKRNHETVSEFLKKEFPRGSSKRAEALWDTCNGIRNQQDLDKYLQSIKPKNRKKVTDNLREFIKTHPEPDSRIGPFLRQEFALGKAERQRAEAANTYFAIHDRDTLNRYLENGGKLVNLTRFIERHADDERVNDFLRAQILGKRGQSSETSDTETN